MLCATRPVAVFQPARIAFAAGRRCSVVVRAEGQINPAIRKEVDKVVDTVQVADKKAVYCRCWRSATFPMCNGAHVQHNKDTGDNVGPLIVEPAK